jgi:hypothetical protein
MLVGVVGVVVAVVVLVYRQGLLSVSTPSYWLRKKCLWGFGW